jgi:hypothetical protein
MRELAWYYNKGGNAEIFWRFVTSEHPENTSTTNPLYIKDGKLYSYETVIGEYVDMSIEGMKRKRIGIRIYDYTAKGLGLTSADRNRTIAETAEHVRLLKRFARFENGKNPKQIIRYLDQLQKVGK